jgi:uncharacterized membrane protein YfcA
MMTAAQILLSLASGALVGLSLGVIGGGGSILAVPLMVYVIGVSSPHVAIGTSALAVAASALLNLLGHARDRNIKWPCATVFALSGVVGATLGAELGKAVGRGEVAGGVWRTHDRDRGPYATPAARRSRRGCPP